MASAHLDEVYPLLPFEPVSGKGVYLTDANGRELLDLYGGHAVAALGYQHPELTASLLSQAQTLLFQTNAVKLAVRNRAADKLADFAGMGLERVFFVNSGAEANENALKLALKLTGRTRVLALEHGFHGRTAAAAAVTWGSEKWYGFAQKPMQVDFVARDDAAAVRAAIDSSTAAIILEPVQGMGGAYDLSTDFLNAARDSASKHGAMLILDEVQTGIGRLGQPFGANLHTIQPDFLTTAKGLAGGVPAGAMLMRPEIAATLKPGELGTTFGGGPLACAAIETVIKTIEEQGLLANVRAQSAAIRETCCVGPVTGIQGAGLLLGLRTKVPARAVRDALLVRDILTGTSADPNVLRLLPPLILERQHVDRLAQALGDLEDASL